MLGRDPVCGPRVKALEGLIDLVDDAAVAGGELDRAADDGRQHGFEVERGADGLADLAQRLQLLHRAGELSGPRLQLLEEAHVLDRDHRLVGERGRQVDLLLGERPDFGSPDHDGTDEYALPEHRDAHDRTEASDLLCLELLKLRIGQDVEDVNRLMLETNSPHHRLASRAKLASHPELPELWGGAEECSDAKDLAVESIDVAVGGSAELRGVLDEGIQHRLEIERRTTNHLEDLSGRRLLLERLGQIAIPRLQFSEQPDVLDGDNRLICESLKQANLLLGERSHFKTPDEDHADGCAFAEQGRGQGRTLPRCLL